jgi:hypothetical protein
MTNNQELDLEWAGWTEVMQRVALLMQKHDFAGALLEVEAFLSREPRPEVCSDALGFRADLREQLGNPEGAKQDLLTARSLVGPSYGRYVHELSLGAVCEKQQRMSEAVSWYRTALRTCIEGENISGGTALNKLLSLQNQNVLEAEDQELWTQAAEKSWDVLGLPGQPDLTDLKLVVSAIKCGEASPPNRSGGRS